MGTAFLVVAAAVILHLSFWQTLLLLVGYLGLERLDGWLAKREKQRVIDDETDGWETDPGDPAYEIKGNLARVKLTGQEQIIVARVARLLRRIP